MLKRTIILIEEDRMVGSLLAFRLRKANYKVILFSNVSAATDFIFSNLFDVLVYSFSATNFNGLSFIQEVNEKINTDIPIIILASNNQQMFLIEKSALRFDGCFLKPIAPEVLIASISERISKEKKSKDV